MSQKAIKNGIWSAAHGNVPVWLGPVCLAFATAPYLAFPQLVPHLGQWLFMVKRHTRNKDKENARFQKRLVASVSHWLLEVLAADLIQSKQCGVFKQNVSIPAFTFAETRQHLRSVIEAAV